MENMNDGRVIEWNSLDTISIVERIFETLGRELREKEERLGRKEDSSETLERF